MTLSRFELWLPSFDTVILNRSMTFSRYVIIAQTVFYEINNVLDFFESRIAFLVCS